MDNPQNCTPTRFLSRRNRDRLGNRFQGLQSPPERLWGDSYGIRSCSHQLTQAGFLSRLRRFWPRSRKRSEECQGGTAESDKHASP